MRLPVKWRDATSSFDLEVTELSCLLGENGPVLRAFGYGALLFAAHLSATPKCVGQTNRAEIRQRGSARRAWV